MYFCSKFGWFAPFSKQDTLPQIRMKKIYHNHCPLCNSTELKRRFACKDYFATGEEFDIFECSNCGFAFTQGVPCEEEIAPYYEAPTYISHSDTSKGLVNKLYHIVRSIMLRHKTSLIKELTFLQNGRIVDYGAGTGYFAHAMQRKGWDVKAIEKSAQARNYAKERFGMEMLPEDAIKQIENSSIDVVTLWHVMEHIEQIDAFWDELYRILEETGIAVIALPNSASYDAQAYKQHWAAYDVPRHLWHFTPSTIMKMGEKHGFILERQYPMYFDGFYISMLSEQYKGNRLKAVRGFWKGLKGLVRTFGKRSASSSIIYVFRKKR